MKLHFKFTEKLLLELMEVKLVVVVVVIKKILK
jgi:hypothetical protein